MILNRDNDTLGCAVLVLSRPCRATLTDLTNLDTLVSYLTTVSIMAATPKGSLVQQFHNLQLCFVELVRGWMIVAAPQPTLLQLRYVN